MTRPGLAWSALAVALAGVAAWGWGVPRESIDWQPALAASEPWRAFSAVGVHYSVQHLAANLAGAALAGLLGYVARVPASLALAWCVAWPLTHFGLLAKPGLAHYGGLSGVLHAGVAAVAVYLLASGTRRQRGVAAALLAGLIAKLLGEAPWGEALQQTAGWDIALAPVVHTSGAVAGAVCAGAALLLRRTAVGDASHRRD